MDLTTCDLSDAHGERARVVAPGFRHFGGLPRFAGPVVTVKCFEDNSRVKELVATAGEGRVLVVDGGGSTRCALLGDMLGRAAVESGWAGIVVWGCVRDAAVLATLDLGIMAIATSPRRSVKNGEGQVGLAIDLAGTRCTPSDTLVADADGIVVIETALLATPSRA